MNLTAQVGVPFINYSWSVSSPNVVYTFEENTIELTGQVEESFSVTVTGTDEHGCEFSASAMVDVYDPGEVSFEPLGYEVVSGGIDICAGMEVTFINTSSEAGKGQLYHWEVNNGLQSFPFYDNFSLTYRFPAPGVYTVSLIAETPALNCESMVYSIQVNVGNGTPLEIICPSIVCSGETAVYSTTALCGNYTWEVSDEGSIISQHGNTIEVQWTASGSHSIGYVSLSATGCAGNICSAPTVVDVPILPANAEIEGPSYTCNFNENYLVPNWAGASYEWSFVKVEENQAGTGITTNNNNPYRYRINFNGFTGTLLVKVKVTHPIAGCTFEGQKLVTVTGNFHISGPNKVCYGVAANFSLQPAFGEPVHWKVTHNGMLVQEEVAGDATFSLSQNLPGGDYRVEASFGDANSPCRSSYPFTILQVEPFSTIVGPITVCPGVGYMYKVLPAVSGGNVAEWTIQQGIVALSSVSGTTRSVTWAGETPSSISVRRIQDFSGIGCYSEPIHLDITPIELPTLEVIGMRRLATMALQCIRPLLLGAIVIHGRFLLLSVVLLKDKGRRQFVFDGII